MLRQLDMPVYAAGMELRLAELLPAAEGRRLEAHAATTLREHGISDPVKWSQLIVPPCDKVLHTASLVSSHATR